MKTISSNLFFVILGIVVAWLIFGKCQPTPEPKQVVIYKDKLVYVPEIDTVFHTNTIYEIINDPYLIRDTVTDTITQYIADNVSKELLAEIAKNHYNINLYIDSVKIDSLGYVLITDSLQANRIKSRTFEYNLEFSPPNLKQSFLSIGASVGGNKQSFDFGLGAMFTTKKNLSIGYDYYGLSNSHMITVKQSIFNFK